MPKTILKPLLFSLILSCLFLFGCDAGKPKNVRYKKDDTSESTGSLAEKNAEPETSQPASGSDGSDSAKPVTQPSQAQSVQRESARTETVQAGVGVTGKGNYANAPTIMTPVTVPVSEYFRASERTVFDMQIPKSMQIYKAMNNDKGPATHEDFMNSIIRENMIRLPELPEGHEYQYDPKTEKLNVVRPAR